MIIYRALKSYFENKRTQDTNSHALPTHECFRHGAPLLSTTRARHVVHAAGVAAADRHHAAAGQSSSALPTTPHCIINVRKCGLS